MKTLFLFIAFVFSVTVNAQFTGATLRASGLTCSMCSKAVKVALEKVAFVNDVKVNIKDQEYILSFKEGSSVDFDALKKAVEDAGFSVASLKFKATFNDVLIEKDKHMVFGGLNLHFVNGVNQVLKGERTISIVDKDFIPAKEFKKNASTTKMLCIQTGKAESCCEKNGIASDARVYHVTI